jgi:hypothetical protein
MLRICPGFPYRLDALDIFLRMFHSAALLRAIQGNVAVPLV